MAQQNKKQPKPKTGLARCLELASGHKGLVFLAGVLAALAGPGRNFGEHRILLLCPVVFPRCGVWNAL